MNPTIADRLARATVPFAGETVALGEMQPLDRLSRALVATFDVLAATRASWLVSSDRLEADGEETGAETIERVSLRALFASPELLFDSRQGEPLVYAGYYPESVDLYLRVHILDEDEDAAYPGRWGAFDVSADDVNLAATRGVLDREGIGYERVSSQTYFRQRAAREVSR